MHKYFDSLFREDIEVNTIEGAKKLLEHMLNSDENRYKHTLCVVKRVEEVIANYDIPESDALVMAAYLHDIGYNENIVISSFHPFDGGRYLLDGGWDLSIVKLVMYHTYAYQEIKKSRRLDLVSYYGKFMLTKEDKMRLDVLTYADLHSSHDGVACGLAERLAGVRERYGSDSDNYLSLLENVKKHPPFNWGVVGK